MMWKHAFPASLLALALMSPVPAVALEWGLGADVGGSVFLVDYEDDESTATLGWPAGGPALHQLAGLRISFAGQNSKHELWVGTALAFSVSGGNARSQFMLGPNYQYNFSLQRGMTPYLTAGAGIERAGYGNQYSKSVTEVYYGGGAGLSWGVSDGAGRLRVELRIDQQTEGTIEEAVVIQKGTALGIKAGFDLWMK